ncbi:MAG: aminodeoxychorismate synthase component I [Verrucomicrobiota bacterium]
MRPLIEQVPGIHAPESLVAQLRGTPGIVLLRSGFFDSLQARYSFVAARPFLTFRSFGSSCEISTANSHSLQFGNPWHLLDGLMARYELLEEIDSPFPLGGCFGYWGYDLKNFVEPKLPRSAVNDLELPDCSVGFYDSLVVFDHRLEKTWIISTGLEADGSRSESKARDRFQFWEMALDYAMRTLTPALSLSERESENVSSAGEDFSDQKYPQRIGLRPPLLGERAGMRANVISNLPRAEFIAKVERAQRYIRAGDIYQVNLSQRLEANYELSGWEFFQHLSSVSPAPFSAYLDCGYFQIASSSPESFLQMSGSQIRTRPIKGTRPRSADSNRDAQLTYELQTSAKEMAELVMITDLLRNDLGKVCEYGSVQVPELVRLERYPQVQHLVSTIEGRLKKEVTHFAAFASCFPGGSVTGAPKIRAIEIIDELEPITRGPYTGAIGYLGFNRESQLSITIRTAVCKEENIYFHVGAGIVADSNSEMEYEETMAKAGGFFAALEQPRMSVANAAE